MALRHHLLPLAVLLVAPTVASADDDDVPQGAPAQQYPQPLYPAPLTQTTQTTYIPQSVALSGPEEIDDVEDGRRAPMGYTEVHRARKHLIVGGAVTFGVSYLISAFTASIGHDASSSGNNDLASLYVPVAGPFLEMGHTNSATATFFLAGLGGAQLAGAIMLYYGITSTQRVFVRNDLVGNLSITPLADHNIQGLALSGSF
ncbi:hypothetical protein BH11MYX1_BH11MYX1_23930 [soil metagenome]